MLWIPQKSFEGWCQILYIFWPKFWTIEDMATFLKNCYLQKKAYFHWHERKEVCDEVMNLANVKLLLVEIFRSHNRFRQEQKDIISNRQLCHGFICLSEFCKSWAIEKKNKLQYTEKINHNYLLTK